MTPNEVYTIAHFDHGIAIKGQIPHFMEGIMCHLFYTHFGYDCIDVDIADHIQCEVVYTTPDKAEKWKRKLGILQDELLKK